MDRDTKLLLGRLLGELYSTRRVLTGGSRVGDATIYGLLNGFETTIDEQMALTGHVSAEQVRHVEEVLNPYFHDPDTLSDADGLLRH
jgi:hypothetical protein